MVLPVNLYRKMKWKINLPKFPEVVYYLVKFLGLAPITMKNNRFYPPTLLNKLYPVLVSAGYSLLAIVTMFAASNKAVDNSAQSGIVIWNAMLRVMNFSGMTFTPIIFLSMYNKIVYLINKLWIVGNELKSLGVKVEHEKFFKDLFVTTAIANAALIAVCVFLYLLEPNWPYIISIKYSIESLFDLNTTLIFMQLLFCIRQRFNLVNEKLYNLLSTPAAGNHQGSLHEVQVSVVSRNNADDQNDETRSEGLNDLQCFRKMKTLHLELCDLVNRTAHIFAIPILLNSIRSIVHCIISLYWIFFFMRGESSESQRRSIFCTVLKIVIINVFFFIITDASVMTCKQGNLTRGVLCKTWTKFRPAKLANEFLFFSNQLLQTPITVSAFGLVDLDYSFLCKVLSFVITNLIIIIQFGPQLT